MNRPERRILHVITGLAVGGAQSALRNLLSCAGRGYRSRVVSLTGNGAAAGALKDIGLCVEEMNLRYGSAWKAVPGLRRICSDFQPDLIQGWMYHGNASAILAARLHGKSTKVVWNIRHSLYDIKNEKPGTRWTIRLNRALSKSAHSIIYNSYQSRAQHQAYGLCDDRSLIIPNGIDIERFTVSRDGRTGHEVRRALGIGGNARVVGHVARFHPMKHHGLFMNVANTLALEYPDLHVVMVGSGVDYDNPDLASCVSDHARNRIHMLGERDDMERVMQAFDVLCLSSKWGEAFPNVLGEAMASGVPCVTTDVGDCARIVDDTGYVVPPGQHVALRNALSAILDKSPEERKTMGEAARRRIGSRYSIERIAGEYQALYDSLLTG